MAAKDVYEVTCDGEYYALTDGKKTVKPYSITRNMGAASKKTGFLSVFRNHVLQDKAEMQKLYPDWQRFRKHYIASCKLVSDPNRPVKELELMNRAQMIQIINRYGLPIDADLYTDPGELRQAIKDCRHHQEQFLKRQEVRRTVFGGQMAAARELEQLNQSNTPAQPSPQAATAPVVDDYELSVADFDEEDSMKDTFGDDEF